MSTSGDLSLIGRALVSALATVPGFATAVHRGRHNVAKGPDTYPWADVSAPGVTSEQGPIMGQYTRTLGYDLVLWKAASRPDLDTRVAEAETLLDQALKALDDAREDTASALYSLEEWVVAAGTLDGLADPVPTSVLVVYLTVQCSYQRQRGVSGVDE